MIDELKADVQAVILDNEERRVLNAFRRAKSYEFADVVVKVHRREIVALYTTEKWHRGGHNLRETKEVGE